MPSAGRVDAGAEDDHQVQVAVVVLFAAGDAAEEDDLLGLEALDDELGDGIDGFAVEGVFDDAQRFKSASRGFGVAGCRGIHGGKDKRSGVAIGEGVSSAGSGESRHGIAGS